MPVPVIAISNRFTLEPAPAEQAERLKEALLGAAGEGADLLLDASGMTHIFSFEVAVLVQVTEALRGRGGELVICGLGEKLLLVVEMLGLTAHLDLRETLAAGLAAHGWTQGETVDFASSDGDAD